jgi:CheY-like chemotaxis protein/anti-sigma regulatory factor (Ser/Thr protein kinase)
MTKILVVDDSAVDRKLAGKLLEKLAEQDDGTFPAIAFAEDGNAALEQLARDLPDLVLTDLQMPNMDGLALVETINQKYPTLPVILMTAHGSEETAIQALKQGASSYVPKRLLGSDLIETVENVLAVAGARRQKIRLLDSCWVQTETHFLLPNDFSLIPPLVDQLQDNLIRTKVCPEYDLIRVAVALRETLSNAMVHGNLEIASEQREADEEAYLALIESRKQQEPYKNRQVHVIAEESWSAATYVVADEGPGFDVNNIPDPTDPANLEKASGRGLLLIRTFMDDVQFNKKGNEITMTKKRR